MKNITIKIIFCSILALMISACSKEDVTPTPEQDKPYVPATAKPGRVVVAYVTYYGSRLPNPQICTHINYAFGEIYVSGGKYKGLKLQGSKSRFESVVALKKQNPNLKVLLSITNTVTNSDNKKGEGFSVMVKTEENRKKFAQDCLNFCKEEGIDGIDINWEFPGLAWSGQAADVTADTQNHVLMMQQLRATLGDKYLLTYAGYCMDKKIASGGGYRYIDIKALDNVVDYVNIMTYDLDAGKQPHNAIRASGAYWDIYRTHREYIRAGVSPEKMVIGIPFYGRIAFSGSTTALSYKTIRTLGAGYTIENWDNALQLPYVTKNGEVYCYYDNAKSIEIKTKWVLDNGLLGVMYWENDQDDYTFTLSKAAWDGVMR
ncbi:MAG: glycoside hydrolase family 18 [Bacteroidales bacterium]|nr:glycoside hydrolase family 18 [Bacteroidales bacterium]MBQ5784669.1 glycoside hydrolase family 18 [Bacteroidales bacterium]